MNNSDFSYFDFNASTDNGQQEFASASPKKTLAELLFAWGCFFIFWFLMEMSSFSAHPLGVFLALLALSIAGAIYFRASTIRQSRQSILLGVLFGILSLSLLTNGNAVVRGWVIALLVLSFPYRILNAAGLAEGGLLADRVIANAIRSFRFLPFRQLPSFFTSLFLRQGNLSKKARHAIVWALLGLLIALVPTLIIVLLLSYDPLFIDLLSRIFSFKINLHSILSPLMAIPLAAIFFGMFYAARLFAKGEEPLPESTLCTEILPCVLLCAAVTPIMVVYIIFFISQMPYYLSAFSGILPEGITYADYAKEGFFKLCAVSAINAALLTVFSLFMQQGGQIRDLLKKIYSSLLSILTLILIATALSKMVLYISTYGLTQKRVYASWLMLLMAVAFVAVLVRQAFKKFPLASVLVITALIFILLIALINVDALIAAYNVDAYLSGRLPEADVVMMQEELGVSAIPSLVRLRDALLSSSPLSAEQFKLLQETESAIAACSEKLPRDGFFSFSIPNLIASNALK